MTPKWRLEAPSLHLPPASLLRAILGEREFSIQHVTSPKAFPALELGPNSNPYWF